MWDVRSLSVAAVAMLASVPAIAQDREAVATFYKDTTVSVYIGSDVGGGFNAYSRTVWRHLPKHLPGNPSVIFRNMPGAGGRKATAYVAAVAAKDGSAIGATQPGSLTDAVLGDPKNARYDPRTFGFIGSAEGSNYMCLARKDSKIQTFDDVFKHELLMAADSKGSSFTDNSTLLKNALGAKFKLVKGYKGFREIKLAMERNEVQGLCGLGWSALMSSAPEWASDGTMNLLVQFVLKGREYPEPTQMGVPLIWKYVKTDEQREILELVAAQQIFGRPQFVPPGVPAERLNALRRAFDATMTDPAYIAEAKKVGLAVTPATGEDVAAALDRIFSAPPALQAKTRAMLFGD